MKYTEEQEALVVYIMIIHCTTRLTDNPNSKVSLYSRQIIKGLKKRHLKKVAGKIAKVKSKEYAEAEKLVKEAWDQTRRELIKPDGQLDSSMGELIRYIWDRLSKNKYQEKFTSERRTEEVINSYLSSTPKDTRTEDEQLQALNNSRKLANRFLELCGIQPSHNLARRKHILRENLIIEGKEVVI